MTNEHLRWPILKLFTWEPRLILPSCRTGAVCPMCVDLAYGSGGSGSPTSCWGWKLKVMYQWTVLLHFCSKTISSHRSQGLSFWKSVFVRDFFWITIKDQRPWKPFPQQSEMWILTDIPAVEELGQAQQLLRCARRMVGPAASLQLHRMPVANAPVVATSSCAQALLGKWW